MKGKKKRIASCVLFIIVAAMLMVGLVGCGKTNAMDGFYKISTRKYKAGSEPLTTEDPSYVSIKTDDTGTHCALKVALATESAKNVIYSYLTGNLEVSREMEKKIEYKFWVTSNVGCLLNDSEYLYLEYSEKDKSFTIELDEYEFCFVKDKSTTEQSQLDALKKEIIGTWIEPDYDDAGHSFVYEFSKDDTLTQYWCFVSEELGENNRGEGYETFLVNGMYFSPAMIDEYEYRIDNGGIDIGYIEGDMLHFNYAYVDGELVLYETIYNHLLVKGERGELS